MDCTTKADIARERNASWYKDKMCKGTCNSCKGVFSYNELEVDHIVPWALEGQSVDDNLQLLCKICHKEKTKIDSRQIRDVKSYQELAVSAVFAEDYEMILNKNNQPLKN
jgi:5-methylcytosine-specific restriction endonuclease McrA